MAKSKFEYVKKFETNSTCLPNCWIVVRIDGRGFHKFSQEHDFEKPNDIRGLSLMNKCAAEVMNQFHDIVISFGESDEYSFVFHKKSTQFSRRENKLMSNIVSLFSSSFVFYWTEFFANVKLKYPPMFDARTVVYPSLENIKDYLSWRQADCHINNLYNTCFWTLVNKGGLTTTEAESRLKGTLSGDKNELLFSEFGMNYNNEESMFKKGTILIREKMLERVPRSDGILKDFNDLVIRERRKIKELHVDLIGEQFWKDYPVLF
ncbi:probable tRNA(His) guanylyltransferase [Hydractinia symbiolongicarpus]|uniref:probable tRNA(His) guanylyltransferase n=1 Tax=Hydractinia symbiolongicarpus TaxID=13093 RepID=UPI00254F4050|nr:probable tRNA(His) guanylyltransferase [Hydractinia symbiolongicarpus]